MNNVCFFQKRERKLLFSFFATVVSFFQKNERRNTAIKNQIILNVAKIALCAVETVLRKTSPGAEDYPQLIDQYINAVSAYRQAVANAESTMNPQVSAAA